MVMFPAPALSEDCIDRWLAYHTEKLDSKLMRLLPNYGQKEYNEEKFQLNQEYEHYIKALELFDRLQANARS